jgi:hypothetical protein
MRRVFDRPVVLAATLVHALLGFSGVAVGLSLAAVLASGGGVPADLARDQGAVALTAGIVGYGAIDVVGAIGLWRRSRAGQVAAIAADAAGLAVVVWAMAIAGLDDVLLGGAALLTLAAVLAALARR